MAASRLTPAALGLLLATAACSLLVGGEPEPMRCALEGRSGPPACDPGLRCISGICRVSEANGGAAGAGGERAGGQGGDQGGARD